MIGVASLHFFDFFYNLCYNIEKGKEVSKLIKSRIIRLFPTKEQEQKMWQHIGASRWVWNYMLDLQIKRYENGEKHLSAFDMNKLITVIKKEKELNWLSKIASHTLYRSCADLHIAYDRFFKKTNGFPKFKSRKKSKSSFPLCDSLGKTWFSQDCVNIQRVGKVKYKTNYDIPLGNKQKFINPRVSYTANGKWILTVSIECESQAPILTENLMGIDLGIKELAVVSYGKECIKFHNINKSKRLKQLNRKLKHLQRNLARKYRKNVSYNETNNIRKEKEKIKRLYYRISNIRKNYLHQATHKLISLLPKRIVMEDLNISGMMKNHHLAKAIQEQCLYEFRRQMEYKCQWNDIEIVFAGRFFPSSKTCSNCGSYKKELKLSDRVFVCEDCGNVIDRDYNAAINLMRYKVS